MTDPPTPDYATSRVEAMRNATTSGEVRTLLAQTMHDLSTGKLTDAQGNAIVKEAERHNSRLKQTVRELRARAGRGGAMSRSDLRTGVLTAQTLLIDAAVRGPLGAEDWTEEKAQAHFDQAFRTLGQRAPTAAERAALSRAYRAQRRTSA